MHVLCVITSLLQWWVVLSHSILPHILTCLQSLIGNCLWLESGDKRCCLNLKLQHKYFLTKLSQWLTLKYFKKETLYIIVGQGAVRLFLWICMFNSCYIHLLLDIVRVYSVFLIQWPQQQLRILALPEDLFPCSEELDKSRFFFGLLDSLMTNTYN